ncbi:MAG: hypothetical protein C4534_07015 [Gaiellales bacterium]|nr:MAG: hypothetical protein C4534_07015 [Gaiellales bacterium]
MTEEEKQEETAAGEATSDEAAAAAGETAEDEKAAGASASGAAGAEGKEPEQMTEAELRDALEKQFREQQVGDMLVQYMAGLSHIAYIKMGLTEDTADVKDMAQASLAIDAFKAMLEAAHDRLHPQDANALAGALASMQMTFAQASGGAAGGEGEPESGTEEKKEGGSAADRLWVPGKE